MLSIQTFVVKLSLVVHSLSGNFFKFKLYNATGSTDGGGTDGNGSSVTCGATTAEVLDSVVVVVVIIGGLVAFGELVVVKIGELVVTFGELVVTFGAPVVTFGELVTFGAIVVTFGELVVTLIGNSVVVMFEGAVSVAIVVTLSSGIGYEGIPLQFTRYG